MSGCRRKSYLSLPSYFSQTLQFSAANLANRNLSSKRKSLSCLPRLKSGLNLLKKVQEVSQLAKGWFLQLKISETFKTQNECQRMSLENGLPVDRKINHLLLTSQLCTSTWRATRKLRSHVRFVLCSTSNLCQQSSEPSPLITEMLNNSPSTAQKSSSSVSKESS